MLNRVLNRFSDVMFFRCLCASICPMEIHKSLVDLLPRMNRPTLLLHLDGYKAEGRIWKRVIQENKVRQFFRKTNISYLLIRTRTCAYNGVRNFRFSEILACFISWNTHFQIRLFVLSPMTYLSRGQHRYQFLSHLGNIFVRMFTFWI